MIFNRVRLTKPKVNVFDLSHERKHSFNMGQLIPCYVQDIVPGDRFRVSSEVFLRFAPLIAPIMHRYNVYVHFFFVPNRLVWTNWELFITGGPDGTSAPVLPMLPYIDGTKGYYAKGTLADHMGIPTAPAGTITNQLSFSELPFRAYQLIYNEYYRDQNLTAAIAIPVGDVANPVYTSYLRTRAWEKDYFTSALPWTQRGGDVVIPVDGDIQFVPDYLDQALVKNADLSPAADGDIKSASGLLQDSASEAANIRNLESLTVYDLENVSVTINELRQSIKLQEWLEKNARGGARYIEQILSHFGVVSSDARLRRPEYLGGGKSPVVISEVLATADSGSYDPGSMLGHGISVGKTNQFERFFEEHGYVLGIMSVLPRTAYQQGIEKHWLKTDKLEYFFPEFALLGEQAVLKKEIYHDFFGVAGVNEETFGYQSRYAEYKFKPSTVHGDFRDNLNIWHSGRIFASQPLLNTSFVEASLNTTTDHRIFQVTTTTIHKLYAQIYHDVKAIRPMPRFGDPRL